MNITAKKSLGQHFLTDKNMINKIIGKISPGETDIILEIGPGKGALTRSLLESGCRLTSLELDTRFACEWKEKEKEFPHFRCIEGNALLLDWTPYLPCDKLVGNIPYNISRSLMYKIFSYRRDINLAVLMVQKEFAEKIIARPGDPSYGIISVLSQIFCKTGYLFNVPPEVFSPPPHVMSACVTLAFRSSDIDDTRLRDIVHSAFQQRRKTLQNSLHMYYSPELKKVFPWKERADTIPPREYLKLLNILSAHIR